METVIGADSTLTGPVDRAMRDTGLAEGALAAGTPDGGAAPSAG
ncbi:hypothetical protein AB0G55_13165 [Streptomyces toyocaensis]|nr:hypothetical protein [Streptomyces toyocaensis]